MNAVRPKCAGCQLFHPCFQFLRRKFVRGVDPPEKNVRNSTGQVLAGCLKERRVLMGSTLREFVLCERHELSTKPPSHCGSPAISSHTVPTPALRVCVSNKGVHKIQKRTVAATVCGEALEPAFVQCVEVSKMSVEGGPPDAGTLHHIPDLQCCEAALVNK